MSRRLQSGKSVTYPYVLVYKEASGRTNHVSWKTKAQPGTKGDGKPTAANLKKWIEEFNRSIDGGTNKHLPQSAKIVEAVIKKNEAGAYQTITGPNVAHFKLVSGIPACPHCGTDFTATKSMTGREMAKQIETKIKQLFPNSFLQCKFTGVGPFILIQFGIDGKSAAKSQTAIYDDPYHMQMFVRGFKEEDGSLDAKQTLSMTINKAAKHIGWFDTDKVAPANQIINHIIAYFKKLKQYDDRENATVRSKMNPTAPHSMDVRRKYGKIEAPDWDMADDSESDDDLPVGAKRRRKDGVWQKKSKGPKGWVRISSTDKIIRDTSKLTKQLIGLDGQRVEVVDMDGKTHRFWVGKSTGWQPVHLILKTARSIDGEPADQEYKSVRVIVKK